MDYKQLFEARESCRKYQEKPIEKEKLMRVIEAAVTAPSACNSQPWKFTVVTKAELLPIMAQSAQSKIKGINKFADQCPAFIVISERPAYVINEQGERCYGQQWAQVDIGLMTMQLCLAATAEGLGTCIMGGFDEQLLKDNLPIGEDMVPRLVVSIGYPVHNTARPKMRVDMDEILTIVE